MRLTVRLLAFAFSGCLSLAPAPASAQSEPTPQPLWPGRAPYSLGDSAGDRPSIAAYPAPVATRNGTAVVIFPGGGYMHLATGHEGHDIALWLNSLGVSAFVVRYRLGPAYHHPAMLADAQRAIRTVRARATTWGVDPTHIGVIGFSAGGHLASTAGTHFGMRAAPATDRLDSASARPDFMLLIYPVITMDTAFGHRGSRDALLGTNPDAALVRLLSNETQVTRETPPTFIVHSENDNVVPVENSLRFYDALRRAGVAAELHVYEHGPHGVGLAAKEPLMSAWPRTAEAWMRSHGWLGPATP
jgi:acetyl esterase/lipase